ncbi:MAG TPA: alpha/beta fold hydrolase [Gemmataceae bacterium]|nr:alpha/beta fold hydrolase [Gemmataceae bacterium]
MHSLVLLSALIATDAPDFPDHAKAFVLTLSREDFAAAVKDFDDTMTKVLPADRLKTVWQSVTGRFGAFKEATETRVEQKGKLTIVFVASKFEKGPLDVRVVFDADKKIAGLQFLPPASATPYEWPGYVTPDKFTEREVAFAWEPGWELPATMTMPKGDGLFPAVVLVHGSGPLDRDETVGPNKPFRDLAGGLASRGIAVLRYEKRTREHGAKMMSAGPITVKEEVLDDALAAVKFLRREKGIDAGRVYVLGHSLGATMAPKLATLDPKISGLIIMAGATRPIVDLILEQMTYLAKLSGEPDAIVLEKLSKLKDQVAKAKDPKLSPDTPADQMPLNQPAAYWLSFRGYEPAKVAADLNTPMLILHGDRDYQVTLADYDLWEKALAGRSHATLRRYANLNHLFMEGEGKGTPAEYQKAGHVAKGVIEEIANWIKR